jgi:glyoxylase I family protein
VASVDEFVQALESYSSEGKRRRGFCVKTNHVLAVVLVSDVEVAREWYERLVGTPPTNRPMPSLAEWRITDTGWLQVFCDPERAGRSAFNLAVDDLGAALDELRNRGLDAGDVQAADKGVTLSELTDPDGNRVVLIGGFREIY